MSYQGEISPSQITALREKVRKRSYESYLLGLRLHHVRGFRGDRVGFEFPVTALIGPNGGGKSTVLGAAACAYKSTKPGIFFPKSSIGDDTMSDWHIEFDAVDRKVNRVAEIRRTSRFRQRKWARNDILSRPVLYFGINRTVPAGEKTYFKKLTKRSYRHRGILHQVPSTIASEVQKILGRSAEHFSYTDLFANQRFYVGQPRGASFSEFHFGAGESSILRMVTEIEQSENSSLVLIEEIENGLHPVATRRLVEYLISAAERKSIQTVFTTHSDYALDPLPPDAIWASIDSKVQQGKLSIESLRAVSGRIEKQLVIFVEDLFAKHWIEHVISSELKERSRSVEVHHLGGDGNAVRIHTTHNANPSITFRSICYIDGDSTQNDNPSAGIYRLPGRVPELAIFEPIKDRIDELLALLTVSCQKDPSDQPTVARAVNAVASSNRDPHLIFNQIGTEIGFVSEVIVRGAFLALWTRTHPDLVKSIIDPIETSLDATSDVAVS